MRQMPLISTVPGMGNERGSVMFIVFLIMATLTVAGIMSTNDAVMEGRVGRNYAINKQCVAAAEASAKEMIQAIDSIFVNSANASDAVEALSNSGWEPYDDYNTNFDFDVEDWRSGTYDAQEKDCDLDALGLINRTEAITVLIDQSTSAMTPGLSPSKVPVHYDYAIYGRAVHAGAGNSEAIVVIGYLREKIDA